MELLRSARLGAHILRGRPFLCNWQVTYRCNFSCRICTFWREPHESANELTLPQFRQAAHRLRPLAPLILTLSGGEPLLRPDLPEITRILARDHFVSLITNGWLAEPDTVSELYRQGLGDVHISIDYAESHRHDEQRGMPGAFDRAVRALETFRELRPDKSHGVRILAVLMDDNIHEIEALLNLAERLSVGFAVSLYSHRLGEKEEKYPQTPVSARLLDLRKRHPCFASASTYLGQIDAAISGDGRPHCGAGRTFLDIDDRGQVARCIDRNRMTVGSLLTDPLPALLSRLDDQARVDPCGRCWTSCRGLADVLTGPGGWRAVPEFLQALTPR